MKKPIAVLISDVHYSLKTIEQADISMAAAGEKAKQLNVPLIMGGDLHDTKAMLRGECVNAMRQTADNLPHVIYTGGSMPPTFIQNLFLVGNHDKNNEKDIDKLSAIDFLQDKRNILINPDGGNYDYHPSLAAAFNYHSDTASLRVKLKALKKGSMVLLHQGLTTADMGEYVEDQTALTPDDVAGLRVISGHYHKRQTIPLPDGGVWDYVGNPYTLNFAEAEDPPKGFQILYDDQSLEFVPIDLRKHVIIRVEKIDGRVQIMNPDSTFTYKDLIWVKTKGTKEDQKDMTRDKMKKMLGVDLPFKITHEIIENDQAFREVKRAFSDADLLDSIIEKRVNSKDRQMAIKKLWRTM